MTRHSQTLCGNVMKIKEVGDERRCLAPRERCGPSRAESTQPDLNPMASGLRDHRHRSEMWA